MTVEAAGAAATGGRGGGALVVVVVVVEGAAAAEVAAAASLAWRASPRRPSRSGGAFLPLLLQLEPVHQQR